MGMTRIQSKSYVYNDKSGTIYIYIYIYIYILTALITTEIR